MRILFDQGTPLPLRRALIAHGVETAWQRGWSELSNGDLLTAAEAAGFDQQGYTPVTRTCAGSS